MKTEMTDEEAKSISEVYTAFGMTAHLAQNLEKELGALLLLPTLGKEAKPDVAGEVQRIREQLNIETLGVLIKRLKPVATFGPGEEDRLTAANKKRNFLIHHYFPERSHMFRTMDGRTKMIKELYEIQDFLRPIYRRLSEITLESFKHMGPN